MRHSITALAASELALVYHVVDYLLRAICERVPFVPTQNAPTVVNIHLSAQKVNNLTKRKIRLAIFEEPVIPRNEPPPGPYEFDIPDGLNWEECVDLIAEMIEHSMIVMSCGRWRLSHIVGSSASLNYLFHARPAAQQPTPAP